MPVEKKKKKKDAYEQSKDMNYDGQWFVFFFSFYLAAGAETRKIYGDVDTDVRSCSMAVLY